MSLFVCMMVLFQHGCSLTFNAFDNDDDLKENSCMLNLHTCWNDLCQITLAQVVAFNRRREGETVRMLISAYCSDSIENVNEDVTASLSRMEMTLALCMRKASVAEKFLCC